LIDWRLIVETGDGFLALDGDSGETLWRREEPLPRLEGRFLGGAGGLCYVRQIAGMRDDDKEPRPELVWLDGKSGHQTASFVLNDLRRNDLRFGPLVVHKERVWAFIGAGPNDPNRDVIGLTPQGEAVRSSRLADDPWLRQIPAPVRTAAARVMPEWSPFRGIAEKQAGYYDEKHGEQEVVSLDGSRSQPIVFARRVSIPTGGRAKLRMRLAMEQLRPSQLQVEFNGEEVWKQKLDDETLGSQKWRDFEGDLSSRAGRTGWLTVRVIPEKDERFTAYWKRLELAF
jgi:hypothetical protein